jgi:hypothetical protein
MLGAYQGGSMFDVVTTYADRHFEEYAKECLASYTQNWTGIPIRAYRDWELEQDSHWLSAFKQRHRDLPCHNYRFDAIRFAHKVAAMDLGFNSRHTGVMIWMDADCKTLEPVTEEWLSELMGDSDIAYLPRPTKYLEGGFVMLRRNEKGAEFIQRLVSLYATDELFTLAEWHDSWAMQEVLKSMQLNRKSLSGPGGHPFVTGPLGTRMDHLKGNRKQKGYSPERSQ